MLVQGDEPFVLMDNGQASFAPLTRYVVECSAFDILREFGRQCFGHTVITGGQLGSSRLRGLSDTLTAFGGKISPLGVELRFASGEPPLRSFGIRGGSE
jgi:hypothetical protein